MKKGIAAIDGRELLYPAIQVAQEYVLTSMCVI
jgi:hypothetical protein